MIKVENYPALRQISQGYYVNVSDDEYQMALNRIAQQAKVVKLEQKVDRMEEQLNQIITLLKENKHGTT